MIDGKNKVIQLLKQFLFFFLLFNAITITTKATSVGDVTSFSYTGGMQVFTAPESGYYQLEAWGAQGYSINGYNGGYGAYATGVVKLVKGQSVFVNVGSQGVGGKNTGYTCYSNGGGGGSGDGQSYAGTGGASTHFTTVNKLLTEIGSSNLNQILLIAAGGGSGTWTSGNGWYGHGGHAGGISGGNGTNGKGGFAPGGGGTQTAGGARGNGGNAGIFGKGGTSTTNGAGGGGGLYGGGTSWGGGGGGGSSYIGNALLLDYGTLTKSMYCYSCVQSTNAETKTVSTTSVNATATSKSAKSGAGFAKVSLLYIMSDESRLSELTFSQGKLDKTFNPDVYEYHLSLKENEYNLTINAKTMNELATMTGNGDFIISKGTKDYSIIVTAEDGTTSTYVIHITRPASSYPYLENIKIDQNSITNFVPTTLTYNIEVPATTEKLNLDILKGRPDQDLYYPSDFTLSSGMNKVEVLVVSEDGSNQVTYTLNIFRQHSSKLKSLSFGDYSINETFDPNTLEYSVDILVSTLSLKVNAVPLDEEAVIKTEGFGYIKSSTTAKIIVSEPNCEPTTYLVKINKADTVEIKSYDYPYSGKIEEFKAPITGYYQLEAWGAQGYTIGRFTGGYGAYTTGVVKLRKDDIIYINVGNSGVGGRTTGFMTYPNGGTGGAGDGVSYAGSGGGSTNITTVSKNINEIGANNLNQILLVSAGGGSGTWTSGNGWAGYGGHGGGIAGVNAANGIGRFLSGGGATVTRGGTAGYSCYGGTFGKGGSTSSSGAGGGGGLYGGGCSWGSGGGGGSSYVANTKLLTYKEITKGTTCYKCTTSNDEKTYTISTNKVSSTPTSYYAKSGAGYARITLLAQPSENNFLSYLKVESTNYDTKQTEEKKYIPDFNLQEENYKLTLDTAETTITISAESEDELAVVEGLGTFEVPVGTTDFAITVTADSGDVKIYHLEVMRPASDNPYPNDITISGLLPSLCAFNQTFCKLNPETFAQDANSYELRVPGKIKQLWFNVEKGHPNQTVTGDGRVDLAEGDNEFTITITSEDGEKTSEYHYHIVRDMSQNADLAGIEVIDPEREINFDPDITEYSFSIPNEYTKVDLKVTPSDPFAIVTIEGNEDLSIGTNQIVITVTAVSGDVKVYFLNVYREKNGNTYLSNLQVINEDTEYPLSPLFQKTNTGTYRVTVPNEIKDIEILATPEVETTTISGTGVYSIHSGVNEFRIVTIAENKDTETYVVEVTREKNSNPNLSSILLTSGEETFDLNPTFHKDIVNYNIQVSGSIMSVDISATPEEDTTIYKLLDGKSLKIGQNQKRILAIAEDGTTKTYTLYINRVASNDNYLKDIILSTGTLDPVFQKDVNAYEVVVPNEVTRIQVDGIKNDSKAIVAGNGIYSLIEGSNEILLEVTAEDGSIRTYSVTVIREVSTNAYLSNIVTSVGVLEPEFDKKTLEYTIHVSEDVAKIKILGIPEHSKTVVAGNGEYELTGGSNPFTLTTLAADKKTKLTYRINVEKDASTNNYLSYLLLEEANLDPEFDKETTTYHAKVPYAVTKGTFLVTPEDEKATVKILNNENFVIGENTVTIQVISESGSIREYQVIIERQEDVTNSDYLKVLTISEGTLVPEFDKEIQYYEVTVPYQTTEISLAGVPEDALAKVDGLGTYSLEVGKNNLNVRVTSQDGKIRDYQVVVTRDKSDEARLSSLAVEGSILSPGFNPDTYEYNLSTNDSALNFESIVPMDKSATYQILGNEFDGTGEYQVIIRVTSPNKMVRKEYILNVTKNANNNNNLADLKVVDFEISPEFNKATTLYTLTVGSEINSIVIEATPENEKSVVSGVGSKKLSVGENQFVVEVTSESGKVKAYTILVTREGSHNNSLRDLIVNNGLMTPTFASEIDTYDVVVESSESALDLTVILESDKAVYQVVDNQLTFGQNKVLILVTSESGDVFTYTLNVVRKEVVNALLENITAKNYVLSPIFNRYINNYDIIVNFETTALDLTITPIDGNAKWKFVSEEEEYTGTQTIKSPELQLGQNTIQIEVTSSDGVQTETYTLHVLRQRQANDYLSYLYTSEGDLTPVFHQTLMEYEIVVDETVDTIELFGETVDKTATVTGLGVHQLIPGDNLLSVTVTTQSGIQRIYYIHVKRSKNDDNSLSSLIAKVGGTTYDLTPHFAKDILNYTLTVPVGTEAIHLIGTPTKDTSVVEGLGIHSLNSFENQIMITVTSEAGNVRIYQITVTREMSNNNHLIDLIPSVGELEPSFDYEETSYTINLDASASMLSFEAITEDKNATITGLDRLVVPDGESTREIIVTAENGDQRIYTITINKKREDNAKLSHLEVVGYPFEEEFNPDVFEYHITVPNEKAILLSNEVLATSEDEFAVIRKSDNLSLLTTNQNVFTVTVTAPDGFTKQNYKIIITREKSSNALLNNLEVKKGKLENSFSPTTFEYNWLISASTTVTKEDIIPTPLDTNASIEILEEENRFVIKVTSEDKTTSKEYILNITIDNNFDLESIVPDEISILIDVGETLTMGYTLNPEDTTFREVKWISDDDTIAEVDESGNITGLSYGTTSVHVVSAYDDTIKGSIEVKVINKKITSSIYNVVREEKEDGNKLAYTYGAEPLTILKDYLSNFDNEEETLHVYDSEGNEVDKETEIASTFMTIKLIIEGNEYDEVTIVIKGDITGDGDITGPDNVKLQNYMLMKVELNEIEFIAADLTLDGEVTGPDNVKLQNYMLMKINSVN